MNKKRIFFSTVVLMCMVFTATNEGVSVRATERNESTATSETTSLQFDEHESTESTSQSSDRVLDETSYTVKESSSDTVDQESASRVVQDELPQNRNLVTGMWGEVSWEFDNVEGTLTFIGGGTLGGYNNTPWDKGKMSSTSIKKIVFRDAVDAPVDSRQLFYGVRGQSLENLKEIIGLDKMDTSKVTEMDYMFTDASSLESLDLSNWDTSNVTSMEAMFVGASSLESLDLSNWDTSKVTSMGIMFSRASSLESLDLSNWDTSKVTNMSSMFPDFLSSLTLGKKFRFNGNNSLSDIVATDIYTGKWKKQGGKTIGTSQEFMDKYDGSDPGTYVWETVPVKIELLNVPTEFSFTSTLQQETYTLSQTGLTDQSIVVEGNQSEQEWSVKASVENNQVTIKNTEDRLNISQFKLNNIPLIGTGNTGIVVKSETKTPVTSVNISFSDPKHQLKANTQLETNIRYQLYNTATAE